MFGGYDRVFPPMVPEAGIDHVLVTDDSAMQVRGWRTLVIDPDGPAPIFEVPLVGDLPEGLNFIP